MAATRSSSRNRSKKNGWECPYCSVKFPEDTKSLQCDTCQSWVCLPCTNVPEDMYDMMAKFNEKKSSGAQGIKWVCKIDERSLPTLKEMNSTLSTIVTTNNERFNAIEEQVKKVEGSIGVKVSEEVTNLKDNLMSELSDEIDKKLDQKMQEESDRRYREMNLCFFNVPLSKDTNALARKKHDTDIVLRLFQTVVQGEGVTEPMMKNVFRLKGTGETAADDEAEEGAKSESFPILKVTFVHKSERRLLLANSRLIKGNASLPSEMQKIIISPDLSYKQREESKKLRKELLAKNKEGVGKFTIRNGKVVPKQNAGAEAGTDTPSS